MISHDGSIIASYEHGCYIKLDQILYIKGGYELNGLTRLKSFELYLKNQEHPIRFLPNCKLKNELYNALALYYKTYPNSNPFISYFSGYVFNIHEITCMTIRNNQNPICNVAFKSGLEIQVTKSIYSSLLNHILGALELDNKNNKTSNVISGFMNKRT